MPAVSRGRGLLKAPLSSGSKLPTTPLSPLLFVKYVRLTDIEEGLVHRMIIFPATMSIHVMNI